jgi:ribosomal protein S18 acetylase RimI-like enzyme
MVEIAPPRDGADLDAVRALFAEYAASLGFSLGYQDFEAELAGLPGKYAAPDGALLLARVDGVAAGVVALRKLDAGIAEMKRLYVKPAHHGRSIGRTLAEAVVAAARARGYRRLRLDTISGKMEAAVKLYRSMGFVEIAPYYDSPVPGTAYLELVL